jgi:hypothetical protein
MQTGDTRKACTSGTKRRRETLDIIFTKVRFYTSRQFEEEDTPH